MEARFLALGAKLAVLAPDEFEGTPLVVSDRYHQIQAKTLFRWLRDLG